MQGRAYMIKNSIRKKLIISMILICLIPYTAGIFYIKNITERWLYNDYISNAETILQQTAFHVDESIIDNMTGLANFISQDERLISSGLDLNRYTDYDPTTFVYQNSQSESEISELFKSVLDANSQVAFASFGTRYGGYVEYPKFNPSGPYDPRLRGWYENALRTDGVFVSEPYETKATKDLVISVNKSIKKDNEVIGVLSITIKLDTIMDNISAINIGSSGYINIISPMGLVINSPQNPDWLLKNYADIQGDFFKNMDFSSVSTCERQIEGVDKIVLNFTSPNSGWIFMSVVDKSDVLNHSNSLSRLLIAITIITLLIVFVFVFITATYLTNPILELATIIKKMAKFDFEAYEVNPFEKYDRYTDEIGEISKSLNSMQDNFLELKGSLDDMEKEINTIEVDDPHIKSFSLSTENAFGRISQSVNLLLGKVTSYLTTINTINHELTDKNDQLVASEEELFAQLEEISEQQSRINYLAEHDPLTNLPNRRSFTDMLRHVLQGDNFGAIILMDMDNFKSINDSLGHMFGDQVLKQVSDKLVSTVSSNIFVSRFGGDEFLILVKCDEALCEIDDYVKSLYERLTEPVIIDGHIIRLEFSMGIARFPEHSMQVDQILMFADLALYKVKRSGKNHYAYFDNTMSDHLASKIKVQNTLQHAILDDGFKMVYQPKVALSSGKIVGYEALMRFKYNTIPPSEFIPIAEENGMILNLGRIALEKTVQQLAIWRESGLSIKPVAVNFSVLQLNDHSFYEFVLEKLKLYDIEASLLQIEITEHVFLDKKEDAIDFLNRLRQIGIRIALDDFGAEYSSLGYLAALPIDILKFDRDMNLKLLGNNNPLVITKLIDFVHTLGLSVVAEGIEETAHATLLKNALCDEIQGYVFSKPVEAQDVVLLDDKVFDGY